MSDTEATASLALRVVNALARARHYAPNDPAFAPCDLKNVDDVLAAERAIRAHSFIQCAAGNHSTAAAYLCASHALFALAVHLMAEERELNTKENTQ